MGRLDIYLDEATHERLRRWCDVNERKMSWVGARAIRRFIGEQVEDGPKPKVDRAQSQRAVMAAQAEAYETKPVKRKERARVGFALAGSCPLTTCGLRAVQMHVHYADEMTLEDWLTVNRNKERAEEEWWGEQPAVDEDEGAEFTDDDEEVDGEE